MLVTSNVLVIYQQYSLCKMIGLGKSSREFFPEAREAVTPMFASYVTVIRSLFFYPIPIAILISYVYNRALAGKGQYVEEFQNYIIRTGYLEETYFAYSISP